MKKLSIMLVAALTVTASHAAFAGGEQAQKRIAQENYEYFQKQGVKDSGKPVAQSPDYNFKGKPEQRLAASNEEYFRGKTSGVTSAAAAGANKADYEFNSRPEQRLAARNAAYFQQQK